MQWIASRQGREALGDSLLLDVRQKLASGHPDQLLFRDDSSQSYLQAIEASGIEPVHARVLDLSWLGGGIRQLAEWLVAPKNIASVRVDGWLFNHS